MSSIGFRLAIQVKLSASCEAPPKYPYFFLLLFYVFVIIFAAIKGEIALF